MKCPKCQSESRVIETRTVPPDMSRRRRACTSNPCGFRFTTLEVITESNTKHTDAIVLVIPRFVAENAKTLLDQIDRQLVGSTTIPVTFGPTDEPSPDE
jgi:hypothetical protein